MPKYKSIVNISRRARTKRFKKHLQLSNFSRKNEVTPSPSDQCVPENTFNVEQSIKNQLSVNIEQSADFQMCAYIDSDDEGDALSDFSDFESEDDEYEDYASFLTKWKFSNNVTNTALNELLVFFRLSFVNFRMTFPENNASLRTNEAFRLRLDENYHIHTSPLEELDFDMVKQVPLEYLHLVLLGVTKKMFRMWLSGEVLSKLLSVAVK